MNPNRTDKTELILWALLLLPLLWFAAALAQVAEQAHGLAEITALLSELIQNPAALHWCQNTPKFLLAVLVIYPLAVYCYKLDQAERDPLHPAVLQFNSFKLGSTKTLQSVLITASANLYMFNTAQFAEMTNTDTMFLPRLGLEKRVIFCVIPDNDKTYNFLITMLYTQLFDQLFRLADSEPKFDGALPIHVRFMMDEFANVALPANFKNILAVCRSRNISCDIILQSKSQIQSLYKDDWEGMIGNCDSLIYLGGNEYATFEWLSKYIGKMTERTKSQSIGRGSRGSSSDSYQLTARDLCSPDEIRRMDDGDCLVLLRSEPPVIDHKFDLMRHPNVKRTPDGGAAPYRMPDDYAQTAQTISPDVVTELTEPAITDVMYEEIKKIMEEIHNEQERKL